MNNTELTLDQLSEIAGGPHYTTYGGTSFMHEKQVKGFTTGGGGDSFKQQQYALRSENRF
jgi:hypothetical protein|tara:strand:+ start:460 stop:639 length:180 start_codon:yes stop_codon:yes gene_type:complete